MYLRKDVLVPQHLRLGPVLRRCSLFQKRCHTLFGNHNTLDTVGLFLALNDGNLPESIEHLRRLPLMKLLPSAAFTEETDRSGKLKRNCLPFEIRAVQGFHESQTPV